MVHMNSDLGETALAGGRARETPLFLPAITAGGGRLTLRFDAIKIAESLAVWIGLSPFSQ